MTTSPTPSINVIVPTGTSVGPWNTGWTYAAPEDVWIYIMTGGVQGADLVEGVDYTLTGATPQETGGQVTLMAGAVPVGGWVASGPDQHRLVIRRWTARRQSTALPDAEGHKPRATERALDRAMRISEELTDQLALAIVVEPGQEAPNAEEIRAAAQAGASAAAAQAAAEAAAQAAQALADSLGGINKGGWDAALNLPEIVSGEGKGGDFYTVTVAGLTEIDTITSWDVGDQIRFNGTAWERLPDLSSGGGNRGGWDAALNDPEIVSGVGKEGDFYTVMTPGTTAIDGTALWASGDQVLFKGGVWTRLPGVAGGGVNRGGWDAALNAPIIVSGVGKEGDFYTVVVPGATALDGVTSWSGGDQVLFKGGVWTRLAGVDGGLVKATEIEVSEGVVAGLPDGAKINIIGRATAYDRADDMIGTLRTSFNFARDGWYGETAFSPQLEDGRFAVRERHPKEIMRLPDAAFWGDGSRDCAPIINDLLGAGGTDMVLVLPRAASFYYCDSPIIVPVGRSLVTELGEPFQTYKGTRLVFRRNLTEPCVQSYSSQQAGSIPSIIRGLYITRDLTHVIGGGANDTIAKIQQSRAEIPLGSVGLSLGGHVGALIEDVTVVGHDRCIQWPKTYFDVTANATVTNGGLGGFYNRVQTGIARTTHLSLYAGVEHRLNQCRFGLNGLQDLCADQYVAIGRSSGAAVEGVDSVFFVNCQFNEGNGTGRFKDDDGSGDPDGVAGLKRAIYFDDYQDSDGLLRFSACHFEHYKRLVSASASSPLGLYRASFTDCTGIQNGTTAMYSREQLENISNARLNTVTMANCLFVGNFTFSGGSNVTLTGNTFIGSKVTFNTLFTSAVSLNNFTCGVDIKGAMSAFNYVANTHRPNGAGANTLTDNAVGIFSSVGNTFQSGYTAPSPHATVNFFRRKYTMPGSHVSGVFTLAHGGSLNPDYSTTISPMARLDGGGRVPMQVDAVDGTNLYLRTPAGTDPTALAGRTVMVRWLQDQIAFPVS